MLADRLRRRVFMNIVDHVRGVSLAESSERFNT
jgi:hypothetical protein